MFHQFGLRHIDRDDSSQKEQLNRRDSINYEVNQIAPKCYITEGSTKC